MTNFKYFRDFGYLRSYLKNAKGDRHGENRDS